MAKPISITEGQKFGRWEIISESASYRQPNGKPCRTFLCKCICGNISQVSLTSLRAGKSVSCGCYMKEVNAERIRKASITHGNTPVGDNEYKPLFFVWNTIKQRCYNNNSDKYSNYGAKGIKVCDEWFNDFSKFRDWSIDNGYYRQPKNTLFKDKLSIDRIDVNKDYCPKNCRWITVSQNSARRFNKQL